MVSLRLRQSVILQYFVILSLLAVFSAAPVMAAGKVNINTATAKELQTLPNIGPKTAKAIIDYRKKHTFKTVDQLLEVKGIGEKTLKKLKPLVTVTGKAKKEPAAKKKK